MYSYVFCVLLSLCKSICFYIGLCVCVSAFKGCLCDFSKQALVLRGRVNVVAMERKLLGETQALVMSGCSLGCSKLGENLSIWLINIISCFSAGRHRPFARGQCSRYRETCRHASKYAGTQWDNTIVPSPPLQGTIDQQIKKYFYLIAWFVGK